MANTSHNGAETVTNPAPVTVRKRHVFYIPGYDPIPPRRYRELYRTESRAQSAVSGYEIALQPAKDARASDLFGWNARARIEGQVVDTRVDVLVWSDIVSKSMSAGILATYLMLARTAYTYIATGALGRLMRLRKGPVIAALYPVGMLLVQGVFALLAGAVLGRLAARGLAPVLPDLLATALGLIFCAALVFVILRAFKRLDGKFFAYYLMHDYAFSARFGGANPPALEARMAEFGAHIVAALGGDADEVLVVGHSSGAHLGVSVLADLIRAGALTRQTAGRLSFLTLGQVIPMVSFLPKADRLRADLALMGAQEDIFWLDVTAPGDGCAFALCDPVGVSGMRGADVAKAPLILSAAFTRTLKPETWKRLRWRFFRLHFQYLCAFDAPGIYDYFKITAGPKTLKARFAKASQSPSTILSLPNRFRWRAARKNRP